MQPPPATASTGDLLILLLHEEREAVMDLLDGKHGMPANPAGTP